MYVRICVKRKQEQNEYFPLVQINTTIESI